MANPQNSRGDDRAQLVHQPTKQPRHLNLAHPKQPGDLGLRELVDEPQVQQPLARRVEFMEHLAERDRPLDPSEVGVLGPRGSHPMPADRRRYLILVDASALGVAGRWLEEAPQTAVVEVALQGVNRAIALPEHPRGSVTHVAGTDGSGLASFLRDAAPNAGDFVWAAGDARAIVAVRAAARELGLAADDLSLHGYYKPGVLGRDHHAPLDD